MGKRATTIQTAMIRTDGGTQIRAKVETSKIGDYADKYREGVEMPPVVVFYDGSEYWLADGYHRLEAQRLEQFVSVDADVRAGTRRDAILYAVGANEEHGLPRSNEDKRRAVETLLADEEWAKWSDRKIAEACRVSNHFVASVRKGASGNSPRCETSRSQVRKVERGGVVYEQNTAKIGKPSPAASSPVATNDVSADPRDPDDVDDPPEDDLEVVEEDDEPARTIRVQPETSPGWGTFEMSEAIASLVGACRDFRATVDRAFGLVHPSFAEDFAKRAEPTLIGVFETLQAHLPVDGRRAKDNRARMRVIDGGK